MAFIRHTIPKYQIHWSLITLLILIIILWYDDQWLESILYPIRRVSDFTTPWGGRYPLQDQLDKNACLSAHEILEKVTRLKTRSTVVIRCIIANLFGAITALSKYLRARILCPILLKRRHLFRRPDRNPITLLIRPTTMPWLGRSIQDPPIITLTAIINGDVYFYINAHQMRHLDWPGDWETGLFTLFTRLSWWSHRITLETIIHSVISIIVTSPFPQTHHE